MFPYSKILFRLDIRHCSDRYALYGLKRLFEPAFSKTAKALNDRYAVEAVFGQALATDPSALRRFQKPPLPFAFHIPVLPEDAEDQLFAELSLSVAGSALNNVPVFLQAVCTALMSISVESGCELELTGLYSADASGGHSPLSLSAEELVIITDVQIPFASDSFRLQLLSPMKLLHNNKLLRRLSFSDLLRPLMRRISSLAYYYASIELDLDFRRLSESSRQVETVDARLRCDNYPGCGDGVVGDICFNTVPIEFYQFLFMGEQFNLGKGAAYGGGSYRIVVGC